MSDLEKIKAERRKELLTLLEKKKSELQVHFEQSANKTINAGKALVAVGAGAFVLYTIFDRYLESKFRGNNTNSVSSGKSTVTKIMYPVFSMALQEGSNLLFNQGKNMLTEYLQSKKSKK